MEWQLNVQSAEHDATTSQLSNQLREVQASNELYEHHASELEAELFSLKRTKAEITKTMLELQDHNNYLQFKDQENEENIQLLDEKVVTLEQQLEVQTRRDTETIRSLQTALRSAETSVEVAGLESLAREQQLQQSLEAMERQEDQSAATETIIAELRLCLQKITDEKHDLELAHTDVVTELSAMKVSLEELQTEVKALHSELSASEDRYNTLAVSGQTDSQHLQLLITESHKQRDAFQQQLLSLEQHRDMLQHDMVEAAALARRDGLLVEEYRRKVVILYLITALPRHPYLRDPPFCVISLPCTPLSPTPLSQDTLPL